MFKNLPEELRRKLFWGISSLGYLALAYRLISYNFFDLHGMKDWPIILGIVSAVIIVIASNFARRILAIATVLAYIGGFGIGMLFNSDCVDPGGGRTNNAWIIWTVAFAIIVLIGNIIDFITYRRGLDHATKDN